ncbi:hypothetical protein H0H93_012007 [Arthromyces matolae]|nr:hypothetical protein H0H93_012007 [Arthromyces matolae]
MGRSNRHKKVPGLYIHRPATSSKVITTSKTGYIRTQERSINLAMVTDTAADEDVRMSSPVDEQCWDFGHDEEVEKPVLPEDLSGIKIKPAKRYLNSDLPLLTWKDSYRDAYLDSLLTLDGRGRFVGKGCVGCGEKTTGYRCLDCHGRRMICEECVIERHQREPTHRLEVWAKNHFKKISFGSINAESSKMIFQLGHGGLSCPFAQPGHKDFVLLHVNGIHTFQINYCGCNPEYQPYQQLLDVAWFPATPLEPQTAATFDVLRQFHVLNLQGKVSGYDFYKSLELLTDASRLSKMPDRLQPFMNMVREWRHLKAAKRSGCGHTGQGLENTSRGGFGIECRACPVPHVNLPDGWENTPVEKSWLYRLILSQDANFRLKNRLRSSTDRDPSFQPGFAYFVADNEYLSHLARFVGNSESLTEDEISHCVGFAAIWLANSKKSKGLRATGVASVSCARHQFFRPNGTGNLQRGEKYSNMDFILFACLLSVYFPFLLLCYDIACQYSRRFWDRLKSIPKNYQFTGSTFISWAVPKFHLPAHKSECHGPFALNYTPGVGRTDGEGVERNWAYLNGAAPSTSQMGPGARQDTLDDFMGFWNFRKTVDYGTEHSLLRNLIRAIPEAIIHNQAFQAFSQSLRKEHGNELVEWEKAVVEWEKEKATVNDVRARTKPDPYLVREDTVSVHEIERQLSKEENTKVQQGTLSSDVTPLEYIISALSISDTQLALRPEAAKREQTSAQKSSLHRKRTGLLKRIKKLHAIQLLFNPGLGPVDYTAKAAEDILLRFPSELPQEERARIPSLVVIEDRLREAHANQALGDLRKQLRLRTFSLKFKNENANSQGTYTRMRALQDQISARIRDASSRYRAAREALLNLRGNGPWEEVFRELQEKDLRGVNEHVVRSEEENSRARAHAWASSSTVDPIQTISTRELQTGEGHRSASWIWYTVSKEELEADSDGTLNDGIRLEWLKARSRAHRWKEEVQLLEEEMRRVLEYTKWKSVWWEQKGLQRNVESPSLREGLLAYAARQAEVEEGRRIAWSAKWQPVRNRAQEALVQNLGETEGLGEELRGVFTRIEVEVTEENENEEDDDGWSESDEE